MRKIKFKTEYVPLSDDAINRHKDFDQLMAMYVAAPKPNWFKRILKNKWTMFGGGLMTGAIVTSLLWYNQTTIIEQPVSQQITTTKEIPADQKKNNTITFDSAVSAAQNQEDTTPGESLATANEAKKNMSDEQREETEKTVADKSSSSEKVKGEKSNEEKPTLIAEKPVDQTKKSTKPASVSNENTASSNQESKAEAATAFNQYENEKSVEPNSFERELIDPISTTIGESLMLPVDDGNIIIQEQKISSKATSEALSSIGEKKDKNKKAGLAAATIGGAAAASVPPVSSGEKNNNDPNGKKNSGKEEKSAIDDSASHAFLGINWHFFDRDSTKQDSAKLKEEKKGFFAFLKDSSKTKTDSSIQSNSDSIYIPRYAQVSFVTPLSSNGIDGYKYMHYVSLNILQGYNGATKGAEFGGLLNGDKGYVTGAQFAGLGNYVGGDLKGAQFGGLANVSQSVKGAQFAGITNVSGSFVTGFQAAGIVNLAPDTLNGVQVAGVVNISSSEKKSQAWQVAGVTNVSLGDSKGGQIAGVFNLANHLNGGQIGLINVSKHIKGFQLGLINISDTISGVPIGLISISKTGIFDVNVWSSDFLTFNGGVRVGSKYVYNIYAYGVSPFNNNLPFGFGIGIGGHIPINRAFIDIDGMVWSMHNSYVSFERVNIINQLRVMGGFTINKYLSVFAGPTLNVSVQDNRYDLYLDNHWYEHVSENTTVRIAPGFAAGIRVF